MERQLLLCQHDHAFSTISAYGPNKEMAGHPAEFWIEVEAYDPLIGSDITNLIQITQV